MPQKKCKTRKGKCQKKNKTEKKKVPKARRIRTITISSIMTNLPVSINHDSPDSSLCKEENGVEYNDTPLSKYEVTNFVNTISKKTTEKVIEYLKEELLKVKSVKDKFINLSQVEVSYDVFNKTYKKIKLITNIENSKKFNLNKCFTPLHI